MMFRRIPDWLLHIILPLLILLPVLWALLPGGLPNSADGQVHFTRITEIVSSWRDGILIPRWSLNLGFGYGVPVFIFGPPLSYWLGALFNILGLGAEAAYKAMLVTVLLIGACGSYRLGHALLGMWAGVVAAAAFVYSPNQLFTLFVQGNAPQLLAWSFMAWALWATIQIYRTHNRQQQMIYALALAFSTSGTLISHNVVTLILVPTLVALGLLLWAATRYHRALGMTVAGGVLGGMMSAWFVVPALLETVYASTDAIVASDYRTRFVPLLELLVWPPRLDAGAINPYIPRTLGLPQVIVAGLGMIALLAWAIIQRTRQESLLPLQGDRATCGEWRREGIPPASVAFATIADRNDIAFWAVAIFMTLYALFCAWMATHWSAPLWEVMPLLDFLQFPARWIGFATFALAWLAAVTAGVMPKRTQPVTAGAIILFLLVPALVYLYPDKTPPGTRIMSPYEVVRYELRSGAIGTTSYGEFNPRWAPRPLPPSPMVEDYMARQPADRLKGMLPAGASHRILDVTAHQQRYTIILESPATISINLLYFPGWKATINGAPVEIWPQEDTGLITLELPAGESLLDLTFGPTPLRRTTGLLSSVAWALFVAAVVATHSRRTPAISTSPRASGEMSRGLFPVATAVYVTLVLQVIGTEWFQLYSPPDHALAAPIQRHDEVGNLFRLLGQNALPTNVRAGETLPVVAYWRVLDEMDENYAVVLQMLDVTNGQLLVEMEQSHPNDIPTSGWATGLYVRNEWQLEIPANALPVQYAIHTGFRDPNSGEMLPIAQGTTIELGRLWVRPAEDPQPADGPRATFGSAVELLGARIDDGTDGTALTLYWRAQTPITGEYSIFVHLLDTNGEVVGQMDGLPFDNRYPLWAWQPGEVIEDRRDIAAVIDPDLVHTVAVGIYDSTTEQRLMAVDANGNPLADNAQHILLAKDIQTTN